MPSNMDLTDISKEATIKGVTQSVAIKKNKINSDDPAFRIVMMLETSNYLKRLEAKQFSIFTQKFHKSISNTLRHFEGKVAEKDNNSYLVFFRSATNAVLCALKIQADFKYITPKFDDGSRRLKIGISAGIPLRRNKEYTGRSILAALRMCEVVADQLVISTTVKALYESENKNARIDNELIRTLNPREEEFLRQLINYSEENWNKAVFSVRRFSNDLGISNSQLYRKIRKLTGKSPNAFIREFRLQKALRLLHSHFGNISEIASASGFKSRAYFSKCFMSKFGILPSKYVQQHTL